EIDGIAERSVEADTLGSEEAEREQPQRVGEEGVPDEGAGQAEARGKESGEVAALRETWKKSLP
ncbi:MAG TPA: hypothetical protein VHE33_14300, partial [Acidobacteriaceae bacterium]|nr:hypothetical protein [Acidobacteriaceae bacterium]